MRPGDKNQRGISTLAAAVIVIAVLAVGLAVGMDFLFSNKPLVMGNTGTVSSARATVSTASSISSSFVASLTTTSLTVSSIMSSSSKSLSANNKSSPPSSSSVEGSVNYSPACFPLYTQGGVHVLGALSSSPTSISVQSAKLYWSYHGQNQWYWLNDLTFGTSFSRNGNFSHYWNPPEPAYYDFEANWTLSNGQVITAITSKPFQVVAQGSSCP